MRRRLAEISAHRAENDLVNVALALVLLVAERELDGFAIALGRWLPGDERRRAQIATLARELGNARERLLVRDAVAQLGAEPNAGHQSRGHLELTHRGQRRKVLRRR